MSSKLESADLEVEDLSKVILACEAKVYETFLGPKPDVEAFQRLLLLDYLYIQPKGVVRKLSPTSVVIVAHVLIEAAAGEQNLSTETLTSSIWVKQDDKWLAQLHNSTTTAKSM